MITSSAAVITKFYLVHQIERMTERSEGNERNEGAPENKKFCDSGCTGRNHSYTTYRQFKVARYNNFVTTPSIFESHILKQIDL